jgi:hydroxycarboxylate dehydrogenase B
MSESFTFSAAALERAVRAIVQHSGSGELEAEIVARNLVEASLTGHDSHGVGMVARYVDALLEGWLVANQHATIELDTGVLLRLDGHRGYGQVVGREAIELGCERVRQHGACVVALGNAHHLGRIGHFAEQCLEHGLVSIHFVNVVARPIVAPWGGRDARYGTNPVCIGLPRDGAEPIVVDFATSRVAQGKTRVAYNKGLSLQPGTILDDQGEPSVDPRYTVVPPFGALLPLGEHKGYGLALAAELLAGALTGGDTCRPDNIAAKRIGNGMLSILIDPARIGTLGHFFAESDAFLDWVRSARRVDPAAPVTLPGEPERAERRRREARGIDVDPNSWSEIVQAGTKVGLDATALEALARSA